MMHRIATFLVALASLGLTACGDFGKLEQGRCVAWDAEKRLATFVRDIGTGINNPEFVLPAVTFSMPEDPAEMGAAPRAGLRIKLDTEKKVITMYNPATKAFEDLSFELVDEHKNVDVRKRHVLVFDVDAGRPRTFPQVNVEERKVTIYSARQMLLSTIRLSEADFTRFRTEDWDAGDLVRVYFREPGKSLRFMNVSRTDIYRR